MRRLLKLFEAAAHTGRHMPDVEVQKELHHLADAAVKFKGLAEMMTNHVDTLAPVTVIYGSEKVCARTHVRVDFHINFSQFLAGFHWILQQRQQRFGSESHCDPDALKCEMAVIKK